MVTCPYLLSLQKLAQLDDDKQQLLFDICCVWVYLRPKMAGTFPTSVMDKYEGMFMKGMLGYTGLAIIENKIPDQNK